MIFLNRGYLPVVTSLRNMISPHITICNSWRSGIIWSIFHGRMNIDGSILVQDFISMLLVPDLHRALTMRMPSSMTSFGNTPCSQTSKTCCLLTWWLYLYAWHGHTRKAAKSPRSQQSEETFDHHQPDGLWGQYRYFSSLQLVGDCFLGHVTHMVNMRLLRYIFLQNVLTVPSWALRTTSQVDQSSALALRSRRAPGLPCWPSLDF